MRTPPPFIHAIESSAVGEWMRSNVLAMPFVEASHVLCITLVFGTILVVDLRLLGLFDRGRPVTRVAHEMLRVTWLAFAGAVLTGALYFSANATTYWFNTAFRFKMLTILAAGLNMAVFQLITYRGVAAWDHAMATPRAARIAGAVSILLWVTVITLGRTIGFTKGYDFTVPAGVDFDFSAGGGS
ncbi:MAG TPA: DUF6644 family protein [Steroidobacteraceae bacterium]|nr:DUF6644 family protein [Steroidobacteraceae bacterium]